MATTKSLNSDDSVYVTTYYGGEDKGRTFAMTVTHEGMQVQVVVTQPELFRLLSKHDTAIVQPDIGHRPEFQG